MNIPWFHKKADLDEKQLEQLGDLLRTKGLSVTPPSLAQPIKDRIRAHMFERIDAMSGAQQQLDLFTLATVSQDAAFPESVPDEEESESILMDRLIMWMRDEGRAVKMDAVKKAVVRERLYDLPEKKSSASVLANIVNSAFFRRTVATVSLSGILGLAVFTYALKVPVTFAKELTVVHDIEGTVKVMRDGKEFSAAKGFEIKEGDTIVTGADGKAVVTYFDKSITRFFENTNVSFDALRSENFGFDHVVGLHLVEGRVWSNVMDYVVNSEFKVSANDLIASVSKRATFSLSSEQNQASIQVFHNLVNVEIPSKDEERTVVKGFQVVASSVLTQKVVEPISLKESEKQWVATNLVNDQQIMGEVEKENKGVVAGPLGRLQENASLLFAFDDAERFRLELNIAERSFYETLKADGATSDQVRAAFDALQGVIGKAQSLKAEDAKKLASSVLQSARNELLSAKPDSELYDLKVALEDKDFSTAPEETKLTVALDQASQFLAEAQDLQDRRLKDAAEKALRKYQQRMRDVEGLVAEYDKKKLVVVDSLSSKRVGLEKLYLAFRNPAVDVILPATTPVAGIAIRPVDTAKEPVATAVAPTREPAATTEPARSENGTPVRSSIDSTSPTGTTSPDVTPADAPAPDESSLPPKLQISRD